MTPQEVSAVAVADKHRPFFSEFTVANKTQLLADEVEKLTQGVENKDLDNINEEIGEIALRLLHIASHFNPNKSLLDYITEAKEKMIYRSIHGKEEH